MWWTRPRRAPGAGGSGAVVSEPAGLGAFPPGCSARLQRLRSDGTSEVFRVFVEDAAVDGLTLRLVGGRRPTGGLGAGARLALVRHTPRAALAGAVRLREVRWGDPPILLTDVPDGVKPVTHRHLFRVAVDLPVHGDGWKGRIVNLSGSGCLIRVERGTAPPTGGSVRLVVSLPGLAGPLALQGEVVRRPRVAAANAVGIEFVALGRREQDELVRYVSRRQSELLRKGALPR